MITRYDETDAATGLMAVLHETGYALYNAGLPKAWRHQPVGRPRSVAVHESQSLLVEMQVCRSRSFLAIGAAARRELRAGGPAFAVNNLYRQAIRVERGLIRVDADEDLPLARRAALPPREGAGDGRPRGRGPAGGLERGMRALLGVVPPDDRRGVLQDTTWPWRDRLFPLLHARRDPGGAAVRGDDRGHADLFAHVAEGDRPLLAWLHANVHEQERATRPGS